MTLLRGVLRTSRRSDRVDNVYAVWFKREVCQKLQEGLDNGVPKFATLLKHYPEYPFVSKQTRGGPKNKVSANVTVWMRQYEAGLLVESNTSAVCRSPEPQLKDVVGGEWTYRVGDSHYATEEDAMRRATELVLAGNTKVVIHRLEEVVFKTLTIE